MKPTTLVYCGEDANAAKALAQSLRDGNSHVVMCSAEYFDQADYRCDRVFFAPDVPQALRDRIMRAHGIEVPTAPAPINKAPRARARRRTPSEAAA